MTFIKWACLRYVQELTTILGPQNRTQGSCAVYCCLGNWCMNKSTYRITQWMAPTLSPNYNIPCLTPHLCRRRQPRECRGPSTCRGRCRPRRRVSPPAPGHAVRTAWPRATPARAWPRVRACTVCARSSPVSRVTRAAATGTSAARAGTVTDSISDLAVSLSSRRMFISRVWPKWISWMLQFL